MKRKIRKPYFQTTVKCYIYGQDEIDYAEACERAAVKYDIDILFAPSFINLKTLAEKCPHLFILAPYMDNIRPGRGMGMVLPEALKAAGAEGAMINHCEKPMTLSDIKGCIDRCRELELYSFVCADTTEDAMAVAQLHPDMMNPEPSERIGTGQAVDRDYVTRTVEAIKRIDSNIAVQAAAGISSGRDVYDCIMAGSDGIGVASGILKSEDPFKMLDEMVAAVRKAKDDLIKMGKL